MTWLGYPSLGYPLLSLPRSCCSSKSQTQALINHTNTHRKLRQHSNIATIYNKYIFFISHSHGRVTEGLLDLSNPVGHSYNSGFQNLFKILRALLAYSKLRQICTYVFRISAKDKYINIKFTAFFPQSSTKSEVRT
jgi:hypothetical protein